ncbi:hypothetical protein JCM10213_008269 [Rhodosporidiobolus nylandii]
MLVKNLLASLALASTAVEATKILVPLYSWSEDCWPELQSAAAANPSASFIAIINPNSGPVSDLSDPSLYCVPVLRQKIPNLTLVGYVRTTYGARAPEDVVADINEYAAWSLLSVSAGGVKGTPKLDGIFFDETPTFLDDTSAFGTYTGYAAVARSKFGSKNSTVIYNPGAKVNPRLYRSADYIVGFEDAYSAWSTSKFPSAANQAKTIMMVHTFPSASRTLQSFVRRLIPAYGGLYVTNTDIREEDVYNVFGSDWKDFVKYMATYSKQASAKARRMLKLE